jgi:hypothetical protein
LIIPMLVASSLFVMPVKDTVWWETPGGQVTEHQDDSDRSCSLMLYDDAGAVTFKWIDPGTVLITAIDWDWQFPDNWKMPVAIQLGDVWLSNRGDSAVIEAVGHGNAVAFATDRVADDLLRPADHIAVKTTNGEMSIKLNHAKVDVLLSRARKCRDAADSVGHPATSNK